MWTNPIPISEYLAAPRKDPRLLPPRSPGIYAAGLRHWSGEPKRGEAILYVGITTATDASLLYRVSQLVLEGIGFIGVDLSPTKPRGRRWETYYHPGGAKIWRYCRNPNFPLRKPHDPFIQRDPTDVFIAWCVESDKCCPVCDERRLFDDLKGEPQFLNTSRPQACKKHHP